MTELNLGGDSFSANPIGKPKRKLSCKLRVTLGVLLGILFPGTGQAFAGRIWRGVAFALSSAILNALCVEARLFLTFAGSLIWASVELLWYLFLVGDAIRLAWIYNAATAPPRDEKKTIASLLLIFLLVGYPTPGYFTGKLRKFFRAFKTESASMCPTICQGERIVAAADGYETQFPSRGDLILFDFNHTGQVFTKRVIGIPGDTIARGPANTILVNGTTLTLPKPCGQHEAFYPLAAVGPAFETVKVPDGSLFVIGDNLDNSYDSRFFGFVTRDEIKAKPKFIYWSHNRSRIGCELH
jgi:signal peptidase I